MTDDRRNSGTVPRGTRLVEPPDCASGAPKRKSFAKELQSREHKLNPRPMKEGGVAVNVNFCAYGLERWPDGSKKRKLEIKLGAPAVVETVFPQGGDETLVELAFRRQCAW
jgi:hypothetical protein